MRIDFKRFLSKTKTILSRVSIILRPHAVVTVVYCAATVWYMGPAITRCNDATYSFGDNTAGLIWRNEVSPNSPFWGFENVTNYPTGESLTTPTVASGALQFTSYWVAAKVAGPVCGLNIVNAVSFISTALIVYGFVLWLTKNRYMSALAGYMVAFAPYFQIKTGAHPVYGFQVLFVAMLWSFAAFIRKPSYKMISLFSILAGIALYIDPYFVLLTGVVVLSAAAYLGVRWVIATRRRATGDNLRPRQILRYTVALFGVLALMSAPLLGIWLNNKASIEGYVDSTRGNVLYEARACSNLPHEYWLPFAYHYVYKKVLGSKYSGFVESSQNGLSCGYGEDTVGVHPVALLIVSVAPIIALWEVLNKRYLKRGGGETSFSNKVLSVLYMLFVVSVLLALPPYRFHGIPTPSQLMLDVTTTWRTINRLYVLVNLSSIVIFAIFASLINRSNMLSKNVCKLLFVALCLFTFGHYQIFTPLEGNSMAGFNYRNDANPAYYKLKETKDIGVIAEYPLEKYGGESDSMSYYLTMQSIHGKKMLNGVLPNTDGELLRSGLKDLSDPQTIPVLRVLGVDALVVHGMSFADATSIKGVKLLGYYPAVELTLAGVSPAVKSDDIAILRLEAGDRAKDVLTLKSGFPRNGDISSSLIDWSYETQTGAELDLKNIGTKYGRTNSCFKIKMASVGDIGTLTIKSVDTGAVLSYKITDHPLQISELPGSDNGRFELIVDNGHNMRITELGCPSI